MTDYEKIKFLIDEKYFLGKQFKKNLEGNLENIQNISNVVQEIRWKCLGYLQDKYKNFKFPSGEYKNGNLWIDVNTNNIEDAISKIKIAKKDKALYEKLYKGVRLFSERALLRQTTDYAKESTNFVENESKYPNESINLVKRAICELAEIEEYVLSAKTEEKFELYLKGSSPEILEKYEKFKIKNYFARQKNNIPELRNLVLPDFIEEKKDIYFKNNQLQKTLFITGNSGCGKTILVHNIAYNFKKTDVYYIDLLDTKRTHILLDHEQNIALFLDEISKTKEIVIIDNVHHTNETRAIAREFLIKSYKAKYPIIFSSQKFIHIDGKTVEIQNEFFKDIQNQDIKVKINFIDLTEEKKTKSMIENLLVYHNKIEKYKYEIEPNIISKLYKEFSGILSFISIALKNSKSIEDLNKSDFKDFILEEYADLILMEEYQEFKLLLLIISADDYKFTISKNLYKDLIFERRIVNKLLPTDNDSSEEKQKSLLFKIEEEKSITLLFPHNTLARYIIDLICKKYETNIFSLIVENFKNIKIIEPKLYEVLFHFIIRDKGVATYISIFNMLSQDSNLTNVLTLHSLGELLYASSLLELQNHEKEAIITNKNELIKVISKTNIEQSKKISVLFLMSCFVTKRYRHLQLEIYKVLLENDISLTMKEIFYLDESFVLQSRNYLISNSLVEDYLRSCLWNYPLESLTEKKVYHHMVFRFFNHKNDLFRHFLHSTLHRILQINKVELEEIILILKRLQYFIINPREFMEINVKYNKIVLSIDLILYKYLKEDLKLDNKTITLRDIFSEINIFYETSNYIKERSSLYQEE